MDWATKTVYMVNHPALTLAASVLDSTLWFTLIAVALVLVFENRDQKRLKVFFLMVVAFFMASFIKEMVHSERICISGIVSKVDCPRDYGFPSNHATLAFVLALAFLNKRGFLAFLLFAVLVSLSRMYLGVHSFEDILGGLALAPIAFVVGEALWNSAVARLAKHAAKGFKYRFRGEGHA